MKWINHIVIGGSIAAAINPSLVPVAIAGSTAPDWLEWVLESIGKKVGHRTVTHYVSGWVVGMTFGLFIWDFHDIIFWFAIGGLTHVIADSLTVMGVPIGYWSDRRFHLFGGRLRTGQSGEYFISAGVVLFAVIVGWGSGTFKDGFTPFFFRWDQLYQEGVIDAYEWKSNRFRWI
jgi:inner membrane protein